MPAEVEAKFRSDGPGPLASLAAETSLAGAALDPGRTIEELDRYLDTEDSRLAVARWACRLREREGAARLSLKGPAQPGGDAWLHRRPEVEGPATASTDPAAWPPSEARDLLVRLAGPGPLVEWFRLRQERTERVVRVDGRPLGTLTLDAVTVARGARDAGTLFAVELELDADTAEAGTHLERLAAALAERPGLSPDPLTKLEHALEMLGS